MNHTDMILSHHQHHVEKKLESLSHIDRNIEHLRALLQ